ncbi:hypothetical protein SDC9_68714 [bioreactor metagenome]|uniref:DNA (cytosine-5-)-methyltransferase n=1 Tax=bioreactor metagenome TaxID=1076179 RepID=A0A644Y6R5_9ZZZZ
MDTKQYNIIDLFSGAGGFSEGFKLAGQNIFLAVEKDLWAAETYRYNHPATKVLIEDIRNISEQKIFDLVDQKTCDIIIGGPPCQGFSVAGPPKDPKDPRNSLFMDYANWVNCLKPKIFIIENVKGLLSRKNHEGIKVIDIIIETFEKIGYRAQVWQLNAVGYGVPQFRERIFIVGNRFDKEMTPPLPTHYPQDLVIRNGSRYVNVGEAILDLPEINAGEGADELQYEKSPLTDYQKWARGDEQILYNHQAMKHTRRVIERFAQIMQGQSISDVSEEYGANKRNGHGERSTSIYHMNNRRLSSNRPSFTIPASFYSSFVHPTKNRNITAREAARLQSFPDSFRFYGLRTVVSSKLLKKINKSENDHLSQYNQIGNAVPPLLGKAVAEQILFYLDEFEK